MGSDFDAGEEFFVVSRAACDEAMLPSGGVWREIDPRRTKVRTEYKFRQNEAYREVQELQEVQFWSGADLIRIGKKVDDFGVEKLSVEVEVGAE